MTFLILGGFFLIAAAVDLYYQKKLPLTVRQGIALIALSLAFSLLCGLCFFTVPLAAVQHFVFCQSILLIAVHDLKTHCIPKLPLLVLAASALLIPLSWSQLIVGGLILGLPLTVAAILCKQKSVGLGDGLLLAAIGLHLGSTGVMAATIIGLSAFLLTYAILRRCQKDHGFAMAPWLGGGAVVVSILAPLLP